MACATWWKSAWRAWVAEVDGHVAFDWVVRSQPLIIFVLGGVLTLLGWAFRTHIMNMVRDHLRGTASDSSVSALQGRVDGHDSRLAAIETQMQHMPSREQLHQVQLSLAEMRGEMRGVARSVEHTGQTISTLDQRLDRIENHLLESKS